MTVPTEDEISVLHVDDDPDVLELVERFLERETEAIRVVSIEGAEAGLDRLRNDDDIECVLSDYEMPGIDGLEFLARVRNLRPNVPFILYTGAGDDELAAEAITRGVNDYVRKDVGSTHYLKLGVRIRRAVERARAEAEAEQRLAALEAAREGICIVDADGRIKYANRAYLDLYGYEREELLGRSWGVLHPDEAADLLMSEVLPYVESNGEWGGTGVGVRSDGTTFPESTSVASLPDGALVIVVTEYEETGGGPDATAGTTAADAEGETAESAATTAPETTESAATTAPETTESEITTGGTASSG
jgi:PAS domain S-box-containing protein